MQSARSRVAAHVHILNPGSGRINAVLFARHDNVLLSVACPASLCPVWQSCKDDEELGFCVVLSSLSNATPYLEV